MEDISGFGTVITLIASNSFPQGITLTQFADDADPLDLPSIAIADKAMGVNGDLIVWSKANPLPCTVNTIPGSADDINLGIIADNNRVGRGKFSAQDVITINIIYPSGATVNLTPGKMMDAMFGNSIAGSSRQKTKAYQFAFEGITRSF